MRKYLLTVLMLVGICSMASAIEYPVYRSSSSNRSSVITPRRVEDRQIKGYSLTTLGTGTTTTGEGSIISGAANGPRRAAPNTTGTPGEKKTGDDGYVYVWVDGMGWVNTGQLGTGDFENQGNPTDDRMPIGDGMLPMLLFALIGCGVVYRRRQQQA